MAKVRISQKNEQSLDIDVPDEWTNKRKEKFASDIAKQIKIVIDEFYINQEQWHMNRCQVIPGTQTIMVL